MKEFSENNQLRIIAKLEILLYRRFNNIKINVLNNEYVLT